jgi:hypothetical protein
MHSRRTGWRGRVATAALMSPVPALPVSVLLVSVLLVSVLLASALLVSACAQTGSASGSNTVTRLGGPLSTIASTNGSEPAPCRIPPSNTTSGPASRVLTGPAVTALTGGPVMRGFGLDDGDLRVAEPRAGDRRGISAATAECLALAAVSADGTGFGDLAMFSGVRVGLARVDVADGLASGSSQRASMGDGDVLPRVGSTPIYHGRLAWVVVVVDEMAVPCPMIPADTGTRKARDPDGSGRSTDYDYQVFLVDARTGGDALTYMEGRPALCGGPGRLAPSVSVPVDRVSVPWSMTTRYPDGHSAIIAADMLSCDGYDPFVLPGEDTPDVVRVLIQRPIGRPCGTPVRRRLTLHSATITEALPAKLVHAPTGLSISANPSSPSR